MCYLQALIIPVISLIGAWIAVRQMLIADGKLQLDTFERQYERRFAVYEATRKILGDVFRNISDDDIREYGLSMLSAEFIFDHELWVYLKDIHSQVSAYNYAKSKVEHLPSIGEAEKAEFQKLMKANLDWITQQGDERTGFSSRFRPFLSYTPPKRAWLLRWP